MAAGGTGGWMSQDQIDPGRWRSCEVRSQWQQAWAWRWYQRRARGRARRSRRYGRLARGQTSCEGCKWADDERWRGWSHGWSRGVSGCGGGRDGGARVRCPRPSSKARCLGVRYLKIMASVFRWLGPFTHHSLSEYACPRPTYAWPWGTLPPSLYITLHYSSYSLRCRSSQLCAYVPACISGSAVKRMVTSRHTPSQVHADELPLAQQY